MTDLLKLIKSGGRICALMGVWLFYPLVFTFFYHRNIWKIYDSYHRHKVRWKKLIWNHYMERHAASISIDAQISAPLILPHGVSGIFITQSAIIGRNVVIFQQVTIGANTIKESKSYGAPIVGDNVYIGAGAKIIGSAVIGNNSRIGANAVVVKNLPANSLAVVDSPRVILKEEELDNSFTPFLEPSVPHKE